MNFNNHDLKSKQTNLWEDTYRYKLMIVDDAFIARKLIKKFAKELNTNVVCEAASAAEAFDKYVEFEPDVVTMDISMPGGTGVDAVKRIKMYDPRAKILMVTSHGEEEMVIDALEAGAKGFLLKPVTKESLLNQFNKVKHDPYKMFRSVHYFKDLSEANLKELKSFYVRSDYMIFLAQKSKSLVESFRDMQFDCVGGIFPEIIYNAETYDEGFIIFELSKEANYKFISDMEEPIDESLKMILKNKKTVLALADGLSQNLDGFIDNFSEKLNEATSLIGVATGFKSMDHEASIFTPKGVTKNSALLIYSHESIQTGQEHGLKKLSGPFEITKTKFNTIMEFDNEEKGYNLYHNTIKSKLGINLNKTSFLGVTKRFPIGIKKNKKTIIRQVIRKNNDGLFAMNGFELNSLAYIMEYTKQDALKAQEEALNKATQFLEKEQMKFAFIFEGLGRRDIEKDDQIISNDLALIKDRLKNIPQCGVVSLMEFSKIDSKEIEIHNCSILISIVH